MLEERDLQAIAGLINASEKRLDEKIESRATRTENLVIDEVDRTRSILEDEIATVKKNWMNYPSITGLLSWKVTTRPSCSE